MKRLFIGKRSGFTLAETLVATLLLLIASAMLTQGIPLAYNAYKKVDLSANAHVLASTTMTELRDKLAFSKEIEINENKISFTGNNGRSYILSCDLSKGGLYLEDKTDDGYDDSRLLVSDSASAKELYADFKNVSLDGEILVFDDLAVYRRTDAEKASPFIIIDDFDVRLLKNGD